MCFDCDEIDSGKRTFLLGATASIVGVALNGRVFGQQQEIPKSLADPAIQHGPVTFKNGPAMIKGYLARPKKNGKYRGVVVTHGNPGMPEDIMNVAAQMAALGYVGLAIDWNSRAADSSKLDIPLETIYSNAFDIQVIGDTQAGIDYLRSQSFVKNKKVGIVGFCGGGYFSTRASTISNDIEAAVAFYGPPRWLPPRVSATDPKPNLVDFVDKIKNPVQFHYGKSDRIIPLEDIKILESRLLTVKKKTELYTYDDSGHAFYDYTRPQSYNAISAAAAYQRMKSFFAKYLG